MPIYEREREYIKLLSSKDYTVSELSKILFVSEPTVRRDIRFMKKNELIECERGIVKLKISSPDKRIPAFIRDFKNKEEKQKIARKAVTHIKDGMVIMLDASTTACCIVPLLVDYRNIFVITSGARTALALAAAGIRTVCTGGELILESLSYVGGDAMRTLSGYNADIAFFSCSALSDDGIASDNSIAENEMRKIMMSRAEKSFLLCDSGKLGKKDLNILCSVKDIDGAITD